MINQKYKDATNDYRGCKSVLLVKDTKTMVVARRGSDAPKAPGEVDLPGGRSEEGESPYDTGRRECIEEIGIDINDSRIISTDAVMAPYGEYLWLMLIEITPELAEEASAVTEMSDVWIEDIDTYLQRDDAWVPFQLHAHKLLLEAGLTSLKPDYSRLDARGRS